MIATIKKYVGQAFQGLIGYGGRLVCLLLFTATLLVQAVVYLPYKEWVGLTFSDTWNLLALCLAGCLFYLVCRCLAGLSNSQLFLTLSLLYLLMGVVLLVCLPLQLRDDAASVYHAARLLNEGNMEALQSGSYLSRYPHQLGLVTLERVLLQLPQAGVWTLLLANLLAILGINYANWQISEQLFQNKNVSWYTILALFAFLPQFFNLFFVYGLSYSLCAASFGLLYLSRYRQHPTIKYALLASSCLALSYWIRNNNSILLIAVSLVIVLEYLLYQKRHSLIIMVSMLVLSIGLNKATMFYYEQVSGVPLAPNPKITWVAMGLQDTQTEVRQGGWYNKYVRQIYDRFEGDSDQIEQLAKSEIAHRLEVFAADKAYALRFFATKFLTTWTESTFQSIWSGPSKLKQGEIRGRFLESLYRGGLVYRLFYHYTHAYLLLLYLGAFLFLCMASPDKRPPFMYYAYVYLAGGILFHLLWETKSQYAYPYVLLLIPFAVKGYQEARNRVYRKWLIVKNKDNKERR